jgi:beta-N-acetylhexosaminidase
MAPPAAAIFGCAGPELSPVERAFFADAAPWGFILFARNVETPAQVAALVCQLRDAVGRHAPILIDQEGGRVARLRGPHWRDWPDVRAFVEGLSPAEAEIALRLRYRLIAHELRALGVDVDCAPVLDVPQPGSHPFLHDRALGADPALVARLGAAVRRGLEEGGVLPVIKHMPGHGRADADSHQRLPIADVDRATLLATDAAPFRAHADAPLGMTAHVLYPQIDPDACGTFSSAVIGLIRRDIGFDGLLMTDDINMGALDGTVDSRASRALAAGCDVVLHCNGDLAEMRAVAAAAPRLAGAALSRAMAAEARRREPALFDISATESALDALMRVHA